MTLEENLLQLRSKLAVPKPLTQIAPYTFQGIPFISNEAAFVEITFGKCLDMFKG